MMPYWMFRTWRFWRIALVVWLSSCLGACTADTFVASDAGGDASGDVADAGVGDGDVEGAGDAEVGGDGAGAGDGDADANMVVKTTRVVFVTRERFGANLGGTAGADALCTAAAADAGIGTAGGPFAAWLSTKLADVEGRFVHGTVPYKLVNGTVVAADWTALSSGTLASLFDLDEFGAGVIYDGGYPWTGIPWTNTDIDGTLKTDWPGTLCLDMTSIVSTDDAFCGADYNTNQDWTVSVDCACAGVHSLYCVEQ